MRPTAIAPATCLLAWSIATATATARLLACGLVGLGVRRRH
jgi:hypothetical protein